MTLFIWRPFIQINNKLHNAPTKVLCKVWLKPDQKIFKSYQHRNFTIWVLSYLKTKA